MADHIRLASLFLLFVMLQASTISILPLFMFKTRCNILHQITTCCLDIRDIMGGASVAIVSGLFATLS